MEGHPPPKQPRKNFVIYAAPQLTEFASRWGRVHPIARTLFADHMPNIKIGEIDAILAAPGGADILYFSCYHDLLEKKIEEMIIFVLADTINVRSLTVVDMYDPAATMERVTDEGVIATANVDAHFWKTLPRLESGAKTLRIVYDQHTLQNRFYYTDGTTSMRLRSAMPVFRTYLKQKYGWDEKSVVIGFPDDGAAKRFAGAFKGYELVVCGKKRVTGEHGQDLRIVTVMEGNCKGKKVVIIDDLIRSGGTVIECAVKLLELGAAEMNAYVVHAEFPGDAWKRFLPDQCAVPFAKFWVSDTVQSTVKKIRGVPPFEVVSLSDDLDSVFETL